MNHKNIKISPSLLSANLRDIDKEVASLCKSGADFLHLDVMDGRFVPNITFTDEFVRRVKAVSMVPLDVHLMIEDVELHAEKYIKAGASILTCHLESAGFSAELLRHIKSLGKVKVGVSIKPDTPAEVLKDVIKDIDLILVMTVEPGLGGQKFLYSQIQKIEKIKTMITSGDKRIEISVDGGINADTAKLCVEAGASILVSGSYIFANGTLGYLERIDKLRGV